jgi:acetyl esterase
MPLDPQVQELLARADADPTPPLEQLRPEDARRNMRRLAEGLPRPEGLASVTDVSVPGGAGTLPARAYVPPGEGPFPGLVWFHGGGWVIGDLETHDALCRHLALAAASVVVSVGYRLAPEHPFPAAVEDAHASTVWVSRHADELGIDPGRLAVGGDSAGGNLATVATILARDRGTPPLRWQVLAYPITDCDLETSSYRDNATGRLLTRAGMEWFWRHYSPDPAAREHPLASPLRATDLAGLPPAYVLTAEYDPLRDEGEAYARRLIAADVACHLERYDGMIHGFLRRTDGLDRARVALGHIGDEMRRALG